MITLSSLLQRECEIVHFVFINRQKTLPPQILTNPEKTVKLHHQTNPTQWNSVNSNRGAFSLRFWIRRIRMWALNLPWPGLGAKPPPRNGGFRSLGQLIGAPLNKINCLLLAVGERVSESTLWRADRFYSRWNIRHRQAHYSDGT